MKNIIVGIGELLWDLLPSGKVLGGAPANFAYHITQLGFNGLAISAIGKDDLGDELECALNANHMNFILEKVDFPTGTVRVTLTGAGIPTYEICENVAWDNIPLTPKMIELASETKTVCFGSLAQRSRISELTIDQFLSIVPENCLKVFDINLRQHFYSRDIIEKSLQRCNILKINDEEVLLISKLFGWEDLTESKICENLLNNYNLKIVILTKGISGSCVLTSDFVSFLPTPQVEVVDTVGAGDSFTAGFIAGLLSGKTIEESHRKAVDISAFVCTCQGAMPLLPDQLK